MRYNMSTNSKEYNKKVYKKYRGKQSEIDYRSKLNSANIKRGTYGNGDGKDLQHVDDNKTNFSVGNLRTGSRTANRKKGADKANGVRHTTFSWKE